MLPAPPGAACSPSVSLASFRSQRKEENLDDVAQGWQGQGGSRDAVQLLAPQILWRRLEWRAAYLGRGPGETVILQHGSPRHWVNATSWGRTRLDATRNGHLVPRVMGTGTTSWVMAQMEGLMAIGGGHFGQAQGDAQQAQGAGLMPWVMGTEERPDAVHGGHMGQD